MIDFNIFNKEVTSKKHKFWTIFENCDQSFTCLVKSSEHFDSSDQSEEQCCDHFNWSLGESFGSPSFPPVILWHENFTSVWCCKKYLVGAITISMFRHQLSWSISRTSFRIATFKTITIISQCELYGVIFSHKVDHTQSVKIMKIFFLHKYTLRFLHKLFRFTIHICILYPDCLVEIAFVKLVVKIYSRGVFHFGSNQRQKENERKCHFSLKSKGKRIQNKTGKRCIKLTSKNRKLI